MSSSEALNTADDGESLVYETSGPTMKTKVHQKTVRRFLLRLPVEDVVIQMNKDGQIINRTEIHGALEVGQNGGYLCCVGNVFEARPGAFFLSLGLEDNHYGDHYLLVTEF